MKIDPNYPHLSKIFLELIKSSNDFKIAFQAFAPEIYADIESASTNPNCSCRAKVENYVNSNKIACANFYDNTSQEIKGLINLQEIESLYNVGVYSGKIERVKISEWNNFSEILTNNRAAYRSFSVVKVNDEEVDVFFL